MNSHNKTVRLLGVAVAAAVAAGVVTAAVMASLGKPEATHRARTPLSSAHASRAAAADPIPAGYYTSAIAQAYGVTGPGVLVGTRHGSKVVLVPASNGGQCVLGISGPNGQEAIVSTCSNSAAMGATGGQPFVLGAPDGAGIRGVALATGVSASSASVGARPATSGHVALIPDTTPNEPVTITTTDGRTVSVPAFPHG